MKKLLLLLLAVFAVFNSKAQVGLQDGQNLMLVPLKKNAAMDRLAGSPYLDEEFSVGTVILEGKEPLRVFMRYDAHQEQMEIKTEPQSKEIYSLPKKKGTIYELGTTKFVLDEIVHNNHRITGYFIEHYGGENFKLLEKPVVTVTEAIKAKTGYDRDKPAKIVIEEEFYVVSDGGEVYNVRLKHRDIKKAFETTSAKSYLSKNKIRSEEDLIAFISYLDKQ